MQLVCALMLLMLLPLPQMLAALLLLLPARISLRFADISNLRPTLLARGNRAGGLYRYGGREVQAAKRYVGRRGNTPTQGKSGEALYSALKAGKSRRQKDMLGAGAISPPRENRARRSIAL